MYRGSVYADFQTTAWQATNIDARQIARGLAGGQASTCGELNRLQRFRDITADLGGYLKKDNAWWYGAYRDTAVEQRYPWLLDTAASARRQESATGKVTYKLSPRQTLVGYLQHQDVHAFKLFYRRRDPAVSDERCACRAIDVSRRASGKASTTPR